MLVHITFEKMTGLKGTFEGIFICDAALNQNLPIIFVAYLQSRNVYVFTQNGKYVYMRAANTSDTLNYLEQFYYGVNFLIKEISGSGGGKVHSQDPN